MSEYTLPVDFLDLECWTAWCLETENERSAHRQASSFEELQAFYEAMFSRVEEALTYLERFPMDAMPADARRLFLLTLSLGEVAPAIELFKQVSVVDGYDVTRVVAERRGYASDEPATASFAKELSE